MLTVTVYRLNARPRVRGHGESGLRSIPLNVWSGSRSNEARTPSVRLCALRALLAMLTRERQDGVRVEVFKESRSDRPVSAACI